MSDVEPARRFSLASFALAWVASVASTWGLGCSLALAMAGSELDAGMVPAPVLLGLALVPVSVSTFVVQCILYVTGQKMWPDSPGACKLLLYLGTPLVTLPSLWVLLLLCGGIDSFVPRI